MEEVEGIRLDTERETADGIRIIHRREE
jgi:hypothetical protein